MNVIGLVGTYDDGYTRDLGVSGQKGNHDGAMGATVSVGLKMSKVDLAWPRAGFFCGVPAVTAQDF